MNPDDLEELLKQHEAWAAEAQARIAFLETQLNKLVRGLTNESLGEQMHETELVRSALVEKLGEPEEA